MTDEEKIAMVKIMTDETSPEVIVAYLNLSKQIIFEKAYPFGNHPKTLPSQYDGIHVEIATYMINKQGAEGETVHLENGVSRHWEDGGVSPSLLRRIVPFAGVIFGPKVEETTDEIDETEP